MNTAIIIIAAIVFVVACIACFNIGYRQQCHIVQENNKEILATRKEIENQIMGILQYKKILEDKNENLKNEYDDKNKQLHQKYINDMLSASQKLAEKAESCKAIYQKQEDELKEQIQKIKDSLTSIQETKANAVEREQRDSMIADNRDEYRIILSQKDKRDIEILNSIKGSLSNPRVLSMLIWSTFIQKKSKTLFNKILGTEKVCGIYKITNIDNNQSYIGQAKDVAYRWATHLKCGCGIDAPKNNKLYAAMDKYGIDKFTFELVEKCNELSLNEKEAFYIKMYNTVAFGYNSQEGASGKSNN